MNEGHDTTAAIFCANLQRMRALSRQLASARERLALMEKRGILETDKWNEAREIRNAPVHDYPDRHAEKATAYNAAWAFSDYLLKVAENIEKYTRKRHGDALCD